MTRHVTGQKFALLTVVRREGPYAICTCDCGNSTTVRIDKLGKTQSCGCLRNRKMPGKRKRPFTLFVEHDGKQVPLARFAQHLKIEYKSAYDLYYRIRLDEGRTPTVADFRRRLAAPPREAGT